jgi:hypothetical protein
VNAIPQPLEGASLVEATTAPVRSVVVAAGPAWQAFQVLHWAFVVLPFTLGADKFFDVLAPWREYLAPILPDLLGVRPQSLVHTVGALEILLGLVVAFVPRLGGWLAAAWLWAISANLLLMPGYGDIAVREAALSLGAVALARLAVEYEDAVEPARPPR